MVLDSAMEHLIEPRNPGEIPSHHNDENFWESGIFETDTA